MRFIKPKSFFSVGRLVAFCFLLFTSISCVKSGRETIKIDGSSTVTPILDKLIEVYKIQNQDVNITLNSSGSGTGINLVGEGTIQIGMSSRDIEQAELDRFKNVKFVTYPIGKDAVIAVVSSEIYDAGVKALTREQIQDIYLGKIKNWKELGGPDKSILVIDKEKSRGTRHVFMEYILGNKDAEAPGAKLVLGSNNEEQTAIAQSDVAIGMISLNWLNKDVKGLGLIIGDKTIEPNRENILNGTYPIARELFLVTNGQAEGNTKKFIDFILSDEGQKVVNDLGYVSIKN